MSYPSFHPREQYLLPLLLPTTKRQIQLLDIPQAISHRQGRAMTSFYFTFFHPWDLSHNGRFHFLNIQPHFLLVRAKASKSFARFHLYSNFEKWKWYEKDKEEVY